MCENYKPNINLAISVRSVETKKLVIFPLFPSFCFSTDFRFDIPDFTKIFLLGTGRLGKLFVPRVLLRDKLTKYAERIGTEVVYIDSFRPMHFLQCYSSVFE